MGEGFIGAHLSLKDLADQVFGALGQMGVGQRVVSCVQLNGLSVLIHQPHFPDGGVFDEPQIGTVASAAALGLFLLVQGDGEGHGHGLIFQLPFMDAGGVPGKLDAEKDAHDQGKH